MDNSLKEKLKYIERNTSIDSATNERKLSKPDYSLPLNLKSDSLTLKLISRFNAKEFDRIKKKSEFCQENNIFFSKLEINQKKLNTLHFYSNCVLITFLLKYIDIIERVKYGNFIYFSFSFVSFYYLNRKIEEQKTFSNFSLMCDLKNMDKRETLQKIKSEYFSKSKEELHIKKSLSQYWKEPMAWH